MNFIWNKRTFTVAVAIVCLCCTNATLPQQPKVAKSGNAQPPTHPLEDKDAAYYKQFLDKNGGYKDKEGGYYNPKAGTYTDKVGGVVDNWAGYTYKDGSYKSKLGDYYDSKENVFKLSDGQVLKPTPGMTPPQCIELMRKNVADNDGFDKDFTRHSMMQAIKIEHPNPPRQ